MKIQGLSPTKTLTDFRKELSTCPPNKRKKCIAKENCRLTTYYGSIVCRENQQEETELSIAINNLKASEVSMNSLNFAQILISGKLGKFPIWEKF